MTDCSSGLLRQYRVRCGLSRPCSGRERVGRPRFNHQEARLWVLIECARGENSPERERAESESPRP